MLFPIRFPPRVTSWPGCPAAPHPEPWGHRSSFPAVARPTLGPSCSATRLTLIEADLVPQNHHAFRQQLVLESTHGVLLPPRGCWVQARPPGAPQLAAEAQGAGTQLCPPPPSLPWEHSEPPRGPLRRAGGHLHVPP